MNWRPVGTRFAYPGKGMRFAVFVVLLAGCGRFGFSAGDTSTTDALPDSPETFARAYDFAAACPDGLDTAGDTTCTSNLLQLTPDTTNHTGVAYLGPLDIDGATGFASELVVRLIPPAVLPADGTGDGMAFIVHADPRGKDAVGRDGALGYGGAAGQRIAPSVAVELDTFQDPGDPNENHVGISIDGDSQSVATGTPPFPLDSGLELHLWTDYDPTLHAFFAYVSTDTTKPAVAIAAYSYDLTSVGTHVWFGVTAGCGSAAEAHQVLSWRLELKPSG